MARVIISSLTDLCINNLELQFLPRGIGTPRAVDDVEYAIQRRIEFMRAFADAVAAVGETAALAVPGNPVLFVRYNCDSYTVDGARRKMRQKDRDAKLLEFLGSVAAGRRAYAEPLNVVYVCYDSTHGRADVLDDPEYGDQMKACVRECIY